MKRILIILSIGIMYFFNITTFSSQEKKATIETTVKESLASARVGKDLEGLIIAYTKAKESEKSDIAKIKDVIQELQAPAQDVTSFHDLENPITLDDAKKIITLSELLNKKDGLVSKDALGYTPLHFAIYTNNDDAVKIIVLTASKMGILKSILEKKLNNDLTPGELAEHLERDFIIQLLKNPKEAKARGEELLNKAQELLKKHLDEQKAQQKIQRESVAIPFPAPYWLQQQ